MSDCVPPTSSERIRALRLRLGLTQAQLAERLGVSFATVNRWENRKARPGRLAWRRFVELAQAIEDETVPGNAEQATPRDPALDFLGDADGAGLLVEAERLSFAHLANPAFATEASRIHPLPHQRLAVYERMLAQNPLRFLLADDAGAGKTIMTGLYIREMLSRRLLRRVLILPPAGLVGNWRRELARLFGLRFRIVDGTEARNGNPFLGPGSDLVIVKIDTAAAPTTRRRLQEPDTEPYDLVVFDEAHKLSARLDADGTFRATNRYRLAEGLAGVEPLPEGWRFPWHAHHLLLLTATPHMGKDFPYFCLWRLLQPDGFSTPDALAEASEELKCRHFLRRTKEEMVRFDGSPLFPTRVSVTLTYELSGGESSEKALYERTTQYIRSHYNRARILNRSAARFAMTVFQRRLASSPWALLRSLERRLGRLEELIEGIRTGAISEEELLRRQGYLDADAEDPFESTTADEEDTVEGRESHELAEEKLLAGVVATSLAELEAERREVAELLDLARAVEARGEDSKLARLLEELQDPDRRNEKLIVFTEHRDTLEYLVRRLEGLGYTGRVASIHGGMAFDERERQVAFFRRPHDGGGAQILVATDAAGEGINLQFCWRMVNYDVPWNPARLEQRMGRIHRYGQEHDPVVILNLVASGTREGRVLEVLLEKLETIRKELGSDKVFDVIGRILQGVSIPELMALALDGGAPDPTATLHQRLTLENARAVEAAEERLFGPQGEVRAELPRLRSELATEAYRRLLPGYVLRLLQRAGEKLGYRIEERGDGTFSLEPEREGALDLLWPALEEHTVEGPPRLTVLPSANPDAILVRPGEPVFEALHRHLRQRFGPDAARGAVLVDPTAAAPYLLHVGLLRVVRRATPQHPDLRREEVLETRLFALRQAADGTLRDADLEVLLLLQLRHGVPPAALPLVARARPLSEEAETWAEEQFAAARVEDLRVRLREMAGERIAFLRRGFDWKAAELASRRTRLRSAAASGGSAARCQLEEVRAEQRVLANRRRSVLEAVRLEPDLVESEPVRFIARFLVVPATDPEARARFDADVEAVAVQVATAHEEESGAEVLDVSTPARARAAGLARWPGFDLLSRRPSGEELAIEVKGRAGSGPVELTDNEWARACNLRSRYWLYVVYGCATARPQLLRVQDPFGRLLATPTGGVVIPEQEIRAAASGGED